MNARTITKSQSGRESLLGPAIKLEVKNVTKKRNEQKKKKKNKPNSVNLISLSFNKND